MSIGNKSAGNSPAPYNKVQGEQMKKLTKAAAKFNFSVERDNLAGIFLIQAMTDVLKPSDNIIEKFKTEDSSKMDVRLVINGIEVPFKSCMESLENHFDDEVIKESEELIEDKVRESMEKVKSAFDDLAIHIKEEMGKKIKKA